MNSIKLVGIFLILALVSCSPKIIEQSANSKVFYPLAPDTAKIQFLKTFGNSIDIEKKQSKFTASVVGAKQTSSILKPYGVEIKNNKIYVADISAQGILIIDLNNNTFNHFVPQGQGSIALPVNSFVDNEENLYVVDIKQKKILVYNKNLTLVQQFGSAENIKPSDVFVTNGKIFVCDSGNNRINIYDEESKSFLDYFPKSLSGNDDWLYKPTNIFVTDDNLYVSDMGDGKVKLFTLGGEYVRSVGKFGKNYGSFVRPKGVAVDKEKNLYVVDASFQNVQIFNDQGKLLMFFGGPSTDPGGMWLPTSMTIDYDNLSYFQKYVDPKFDLKYLILVINQFGPNKLNVYGRVDPK